MYPEVPCKVCHLLITLQNHGQYNIDMSNYALVRYSVHHCAQSFRHTALNGGFPETVKDSAFKQAKSLRPFVSYCSMHVALELFQCIKLPILY